MLWSTYHTLYPLVTRHVPTLGFNWLALIPDEEWPAHLHRHNETYGTIHASTSVSARCKGFEPDQQRLRSEQQVTLLMSFFVARENNKSSHMANVADPGIWSRIRRATIANHAAVAAAASLEYESHGRDGDHPRCGKLRAVADALRRIPVGQWLFYLCPSKRGDLEEFGGDTRSRHADRL
jgi:hypothetical protein